MSNSARVYPPNEMTDNREKATSTHHCDASEHSGKKVRCLIEKRPNPHLESQTKDSFDGLGRVCDREESDL